MSIPAKRFIRSLLLRLFPKASEPMLVLLLVRAGNPNRGPGYRASLRTPDEGAHLVTRGIILNPRYGDPPPELSISLATFSPCTSHNPSINSKIAMRASIWVLKRRRSSSSHSRVAKKLSHMALSKQSPPCPSTAAPRPRHSVCRRRTRCTGCHGRSDESPPPAGVVRAPCQALPVPVPCADEFPSPRPQSCG